MSVYKVPVKTTSKDGEEKTVMKWQVDVSVRLPNRKQKRVRVLSPVQNAQGAKKYELEVRAAILDGTWGQKPAEEAPKLGDYVETFIREHSIAKGLKPSTIREQRAAFRLYLVPTIGKATRVDELGIQNFYAVRGAMAAKGLHGKTINNALGVLNKIIAHYHVSRGLPCPTFYDVRAKVPKSPPKFWEPEQYNALVAAARTTEELVTVLLMGDCGLRAGEVIALKWSHVRWEPKPQLVVQESFTDGHFGPPKGNKHRTVPMTARVVAALRELPRGIAAPWVLPREVGSSEHSTLDSLAWLVLRAERAAGLDLRKKREKGKLHKLRHTYVTRLAAAGVPARTIMDLAGHEQMATTMRYMHVIGGGQESAVAALEAFDESRQSDANLAEVDAQTV